MVFGMRRNADLKGECSGNGQSASLDERMIHSVIAKLTAAGWKEDLLPMKDLQPHPLSELWPVARSVRPLTIKGIRSSSRAKHNIDLVFLAWREMKDELIEFMESLKAKRLAST